VERISSIAEFTEAEEETSAWWVVILGSLLENGFSCWKRASMASACRWASFSVVKSEWDLVGWDGDLCGLTIKVNNCKICSTGEECLCHC